MRADAAILPDPAAAEGRPFRRKVFYIPGYDPFPPRRYRELYRKEGAEQARISGYGLTLVPARVEGGYGWEVAGRMGQPATAEIEVLIWADLVRDSMERGLVASYLQVLQTARIFIGSGALGRLIRLRKGPAIAAFYPVAVLLIQALVALGLGLGLGRILSGAIGFLGWLALPPAVWATLWGFRRQDHRLFAWYLMLDYAYAAQAGGAYPAALSARLFGFAARLRAALAQDYDEVLVVGHSSGAHLGVSVLAQVIRAGLPAPRPALALLTLGQAVPMVSFLPGARQLRADLRYLSARDDLTWVDVTAPGDGCTFALCDPVAVTGVAPADQKWPLVISAAFRQTLSPQTWARLRRRFFRLHFQYLCAFDRPGDYDYFQITAGPLTLAQRYAGRKPSASRITRPVSGYVDT